MANELSDDMDSSRIVHGAAPINHLNTDIESGQFSDKSAVHALAHSDEEEEEEDEDMDALIDELESQDGHQEEEEEGETINPGTGRVVPEDQLETDTSIGLTEQEVHMRRKKYGMNQMKEEKENLILKFLGYFVGPIQFVMEVCLSPTVSRTIVFSNPQATVVAAFLLIAAFSPYPSLILSVPLA